ncbi:hypothetical protein M514_09147 [Trichuris suis]|uniref:Uncharacterized protein n=1 Tax=Trichuris suis TaxID=68888 RepID=A0A085MS43_9BILA|nr:hypothetical protein M513_09147 [Trichuris suis]KFD60039.1 hypothetical protein M514_09147 [Trichuris suis]
MADRKRELVKLSGFFDEQIPLDAPRTSPYEKPPGKTMPRNGSKSKSVSNKSCIAISHTSKPTKYSAAAISRSPLVPSSRIIATFMLLSKTGLELYAI